MKRITYLLMLTILCGCATQKEEAAKQPNIVFIFADDMTYTAVNALGNDEIETPNINRLVAQGTTFSNAYNMGAWNGAVCAASRAMIISGRSVWDADKFRKDWSENRGYDKSWGNLMQGAGYDTYMTGKWHVDAPADSIFNNVAHVRAGMPDDAWDHEKMEQQFEAIAGTDTDPGTLMPTGYNRPLSKNDSTWSPTDTKFGGFWEGGTHWSEVLKDDALGFIDRTKESEKPFFMYLAFNAPHDPRQAPQRFLDMYPVDKISLPESFLPVYPYKDSIGNGVNLRDEALAPFPRTELAIKTHTREYYALITHLDEQIGVILDSLEAKVDMDNTYIIFTSDHGLAMGRHGLLGKQTQYDHSIRPPFVITGPNVPKGTTNTADIYLQDAMATSLELAGVAKPDYVFFNSILDLIDGSRTKSHYDAIYNGYIDYQRMIRKDGFKLIVYPKLDKVLLFDLENDPEEITDLAGIPEYKDKVSSLFKELLQLQNDMHDPLDISSIPIPN